MSALPDGDDELDSFDLVEIEKRFSTAVGYAFYRSYSDKDEFHQLLNALRSLLTKRQSPFQSFDISGAANMFLGNAYRIAKAARLIFDEADLRTDNSPLHGMLMSVHHDLIDGVLQPLYTLNSYLSKFEVLQILKTDKDSIAGCFDAAFECDFAEARHALAHEEDRLIISPKPDEPLTSIVERIQFRGTTGAGLKGLRYQNGAGKSFHIGFTEEHFCKLVTLMIDLIQKRT
jgi:hypothetical protein